MAYGGIETGGTKIVVGVGTGPDDVQTQAFPTGSDPRAGMARAADFLVEQSGGTLDGIGIGTFGPCDPDPESPTWGYVTTTPKPGWRDADIVGLLKARLAELGADIPPIGFDTDVNVAALGEHRWGAGQDVENLIYVTIGTGIGGGALIGGRLLHGLSHPEMGHMLLGRAPGELDAFTGICPFHGDCWEGMAAGPAIQARWGAAGQELALGHPAWTLEAEYIARGLLALTCTLSPERIIVGGGVGSLEQVLTKVRTRMVELLNSYLPHPRITEQTDEFIVAPALGGQAGVLGCLALAGA